MNLSQGNRRRFASLAVVATLVGAACQAPGTEVEPAPTIGPSTGPDGDAFYLPPPPPEGAKPGDLIWVRPFNGLANSVGYHILYWSGALDGTLAATSGVVFLPAEPQSEPRPIIAWAHGSAGLGDQCAPSKWDFERQGRARSIAALVIQRGAIFVATDYQGLGTPGEHPYIVGQAAGRDVLDSIRAAAALTQTGDPTAVVLGESQGGGSALFAAELAPSYAPDVKLAGAVAVAPPSNLIELASALDGGKYFGYTLMAINGIGTVYPAALSRQDALTAAGKEALSAIRTECSDVILTRYAGKKQDEFGVGAIVGSAEFQQRLTENEPGHTRTSVPIFVVHGDADDTIPVEGTIKLVQAYCAAGVPVTSKILPGGSHADATSTAMPDIVTYLTQRLNGEPAPSTCTSG